MNYRFKLYLIDIWENVSIGQVFVLYEILLSFVSRNLTIVDAIEVRTSYVFSQLILSLPHNRLYEFLQRKLKLPDFIANLIAAVTMKLIPYGLILFTNSSLSTKEVIGASAVAVVVIGAVMVSVDSKLMNYTWYFHGFENQEGAKRVANLVETNQINIGRINAFFSVFKSASVLISLTILASSLVLGAQLLAIFASAITFIICMASLSVRIK